MLRIPIFRYISPSYILHSVTVSLALAHMAAPPRARPPGSGGAVLRLEGPGARAVLRRNVLTAGRAVVTGTSGRRTVAGYDLGKGEVVAVWMRRLLPSCFGLERFIFPTI